VAEEPGHNSENREVDPSAGSSSPQIVRRTPPETTFNDVIRYIAVRSEAAAMARLATRGTHQQDELEPGRRPDRVPARPAADGDLVPDFIPVLGYADDVLLVAIVLRSVLRHTGPDALGRHWPGTPTGLQLIERLAGRPPEA